MVSTPGSAEAADSATVWPAWLLWASLTSAVVVCYPWLPSQLPLLREPAAGQWAHFAPKSWWWALRLPLMGAGQLLATHVLLRAAEGAGAWRWAQLWRVLLWAACGKTAVELVQLCVLPWRSGGLGDTLFYWAALLPVVAGLLVMLPSLLRHRARLDPPRLTARHGLALGLAALLWGAASASAMLAS